MKKNTLILLIAFLIVSFNAYSQVDQDQLLKFNQVIENISNFYVDSVNNSDLIEKAIISTLKELDPHSVYFSKDEVEEINRGLVGSFVGVGLSYDIINDTVMVLSVIKGGPSESAGLLSGDRIIKIEEEQIAGVGITDKKLKDLLTGKKGSKVNVLIKRSKQKRFRKIEIERDDIPVKSIDAAYIHDNDIAYIKLNRFSATTIDEFKKVTDSLLGTGIDKVILDLRNNSGGYLYVSVKLLEFFLDKNISVLYTMGLHRSDKEYKTHKVGKYKKNDLVILINETSASASEIVSGAIQDWDRGVIIGRRSYGKGLVQKPIYLIDGSMMRLTIAKYYTPSGRNIQKPYNNGIENYKKEVSDRLENGELMNKDSIKYNDSLKFYTLNNKRMIYGGGGIMPDIFIPVDTLKYPYFYRQKNSEGVVNEFVHLFVDENRDYFKRLFPDFKTYNLNFSVNDSHIDELINYICDDIKKRLIYTEEIKDHELIKIQLKALIAYDIWGESEYYEIINMKDKVYLKALEVLKNKKLYTEILHNNIVGEYQE